jgi:signal transduction histidine kinase
MERQISNLTRLVDDLLDVSRITQRKIALKRQAVDLRDLVRQALEAAQPAIADAMASAAEAARPSDAAG